VVINVQRIDEITTIVINDQEMVVVVVMEIEMPCIMAILAVEYERINS
jgi:hypothetical protein